MEKYYVVKNVSKNYYLISAENKLLFSEFIRRDKLYLNPGACKGLITKAKKLGCKDKLVIMEITFRESHYDE
jgi:hypothetical protein